MLKLERSDQDLIAELGEVTILIADDKPSRNVLRNFLNGCEIRSAQIKVVDTFDEAVSEIAVSRPSVVFSDFELSGSKCLDLKKRYEEMSSLREISVFFAVANDDSQIVANTLADEGVDGLLLRPLSPADLKESIFSVLSRKIRPAPYTATLQEGKGKHRSGEYEKALELFERAHRLNPAPSLALAHEAAVLLDMGEIEAAEARLTRGLKSNPTHYRCLLGMFDVCLKRKDFAGAYERARTLASHHSIPVNRLADFIDVAVRTHQFEDVLEFSRLANAVGGGSPALRKSLGAGLVVAGLAFLRRGEHEAACAAFKKAENLGPDDFPLLKRIYCALIEFGVQKEAQAMSARLPDEILNSLEVQMTEFRRIERSGDRMQALRFGIQLIRAGVEDVTLYETVIRYSIDLGRRGSVVTSLIELAMKKFPDERARFLLDLSH